VRYVAPFIAFLLLLVASDIVPLDTAWGGPLRVIVLALVCAVCWPRELPLRPKYPLASVAIGALVFVLLRTFALDFLVKIGLDGNRFRLLIGLGFLAIVFWSSDGVIGLWQRWRQSQRRPAANQPGRGRGHG